MTFLLRRLYVVSMSELRWSAIVAGLVLAVALVLLAQAVVGQELSFAFALLIQFVALIVGGFAAARLAGRTGLAHGMAVAIAFIIGATAVQGWVEMNLATAEGPGAVGSIDLGSLIVADLVHLSAGTLGGWLAGTGGLPSRSG